MPFQHLRSRRHLKFPALTFRPNIGAWTAIEWRIWDKIFRSNNTISFIYNNSCFEGFFCHVSEAVTNENISVFEEFHLSLDISNTSKKWHIFKRKLDGRRRTLLKILYRSTPWGFKMCIDKCNFSKSFDIKDITTFVNEDDTTFCEANILEWLSKPTKEEI